MRDITRALVSAPPDTAITPPPEHLPRLFDVDLVALRRELDALGIDEVQLAFWSAMPPKQILTILATGQATRVQVRRMRRGLRWAWVDKLYGLDGQDEVHWNRLTLRLIAPALNGR